MKSFIYRAVICECDRNSVLGPVPSNSADAGNREEARVLDCPCGNRKRFAASDVASVYLEMPLTDAELARHAARFSYYF